MPVEVILPKVDMDMTHGTLAVWHVAEGDSVARGAPLFDIETDKAAMEVEAPASGRLGSVTARPGDKVAVGTVVALLYAPGEVIPDTLAAAVPGGPEAAVLAVRDNAPTVPDNNDIFAPADAGKSTSRATPAARAAARTAGIDLADLADLAGTGPRGRIQRDDVVARVRDLADPTVTSPSALTQAPALWTAQPGPLHISQRKGSGIPLVLLHGFTADSQSWAPLEKAFGPQRPLIRIDLPGHGRSPRRRLRGFADLASMVAEAFDTALGSDETVHLLGHSLGGALALAVADIRPRQVASLTLIAPAGLGPEIDAGTLAGIVRARSAESLAPWLRRLTATPQGIGDDYARAAMALRSDPALRAAQADMAEVLFPDGVQPFDLRPALARLEIPACLIWGRQDHILPYRHALAADGEIAMHLLSGAGHVPQIECPDRVARIITRHLNGAEAPALR